MLSWNTFASFFTSRDQIAHIFAQSHTHSALCAHRVSRTSIAIKVFDILSSSTELRDKLEDNTAYFKEKIIAAGFDVKAGDSPIVPIMLYDASLSQKFADMLLEEGVYAIGFFYPVVPKGKARIRTQISAAHERHHLDKAVDAFIKVGKELNVIKWFNF